MSGGSAEVADPVIRVDDLRKAYSEIFLDLTGRALRD
jgi:hypothetical protein